MTSRRALAVTPVKNASSRVGEWPFNLDVSDLLATGWRPTPLRQFILKLHSRCNLACDYCYVYELADQTWRDQPRTMNGATIGRAAERIAEHAAAHDLRAVQIVLHGGEPLLGGAGYLDAAAARLRRIEGPRVALTLQTNGTLLDSDILGVLDRHDIRVGVSLDGTGADHDRSRRLPSGAGSHGMVEAALLRLTAPAHRRLFAGLLCTVDLRSDPLETYEELLRFDPPTIDFLLPHGNWTSPPPARSDDARSTPYAGWLIPIFDRWYRSHEPATEVRLFRDIIDLLLGGHSSVETIGLAPTSVSVIETDGSWEQVDSLKSTYHGAAATGLDIWRHSVDTVLLQPALVARQIGAAALAPQCRRCPFADVCGGGHYPHRYRAGAGFRNPSVYCPDLFAFIDHVRKTIQADLGPLRRPS